MYLLFTNTKWLRRFCAALLACIVFSGAAAFAQSPIERLVSPGKLSDAHIEQEKECSSCHTSFNKKAQSGLCLACHEVVDADVKAGQGYHGRSPYVQGVECKTCHTEHEGRGADIVGLDQATFDHTFTDYRLEGKHAQAECADCHKQDALFSEAPHDCAACHTGDDPHFGRLGEDCASCHNPADWKDVAFDHATTDFALLGAHADVSCNACHKDQVWEGLGAECVDCHKQDDAHEGRFGPDCGSCHEAAAWTAIRFNHDTTGFRLVGRHSTVECAACHGAGKPDPAPTACIGCHKSDDTHKGLNGEKCEDCHTARGWKQITFDHASTGFALLGKHAAASCDTCHTQPMHEWTPPSNCIDCHAEDDKHEGLLGPECAECHEETGWATVRFDHDRDTDFMLLGKHDTPNCGACHTQSIAISTPSSTCVGCHRQDDPHEGQLGDGCSQCHGVVSWTEQVLFDHEFTNFPLLGQHATASCDDCHKTKAFLEAPLECNGCHVEDDIHKGGLGPECATCHNPKGWTYWTFDHNSQTDFALTGKHADLTCSECHTSNKKGDFEVSSRCVSCHAADDKHRGAFGTSCDRCHNTEAFWAVDVVR